jgi:predicted O-methyltransferase YrrM
MYSKSHLLFKWLQYYIHASNGKGHGIHSPFVYEFIREVLNDRNFYEEYGRIEALRKKMLGDNRTLQVNDPGAGSSFHSGTIRSVSDIARRSASTQKFARLLYRLAKYYQAGGIIELGTSVGISASYLAMANPDLKLITIEGSDTIAGLARENFHALGLKNIQLFNGDFAGILPDVINSNPLADLIFIDGNHRKKPVLEYFEFVLGKISKSSLIIIHDIHWSGEMEEAWSVIQADPRVKMSIDIFSAGLIFFREEFRVKQEFIIRF